MPRNKYDDAHGVVRVQWEQGPPDASSGRMYLVEIWRSETDLDYNEPRKPGLHVTASLELHVYKDSKWWAVGYAGSLAEAKPGEIRRYATLRQRHWRSTITLDGWIS